MTPNITPEALERAAMAYDRALSGPGSHRRGLEAAILAALPELLAAQPASSAGAQMAAHELASIYELLGVSNACDAGAEIARLHIAAPVAGEAALLPLAVWYGPMPESNGKQNWTVILHRAGADAFAEPHVCLFRSEYPDRMRYEADLVKYLLGQREDDPDILAYDSELHSGYVQPAPAAVPVEDISLAAQMLTWGREDGLTVKQAAQVEAHARKLFDLLKGTPQPAAQGVDLGQFRGWLCTTGDGSVTDWTRDEDARERFVKMGRAVEPIYAGIDSPQGDSRPCYVCGETADSHPWETQPGGGKKRGACPAAQHQQKEIGA